MPQSTLRRPTAPYGAYGACGADFFFSFSRPHPEKKAYFFESTGCTYPLPFITPRPVTYTADGYPIKSPSCDPHAGGKVPRSEVDEKEMINFGRFNDSTTVLARGPCSFLHNGWRW